MPTLNFASIWEDTSGDGTIDLSFPGQASILDSGADTELTAGEPATITSGAATIDVDFEGFNADGDPVFTVISSSTPVFTDGATVVLTTDTLQPSSANVTDFSTPLPICFAPGTLIATPEGETAVEALKNGDLVSTADGREVPVKWIGRQTVQRLFAGERARPVRVAAGALGDGLPHTDLVLTPDHALILDGFAINAGALVNGTTITLEPLSAIPDRVTYYHVETENHDAILANGAAAETYVDYVQRRAFDNHADYVALYGDACVITEMPLPRTTNGRLLPPAARARVARHAA